MMKVWNMVLVAATFFLCIFGTFMTRSGIVSSVHAFATSSIGSYFLVFLTLGIAFTIYMILGRLDYLKSESELESVVSRESSFLFNNLILLASCFATLWGTLFPVISEAVTGEKVSVDAPWFNRINIPIGLFLLFLTGVGPLLAWRRSSSEGLKRNFQWPFLGMLVLMAGLAVAGIRHLYALMTFGLCFFVAWTIAQEFWKGASTIAKKEATGLLRGMIELTHRNTRRYGGYLVHMGIVVMFIGFAGAAFNQDSTVEVEQGKAFHLGRYELKVTGINSGQTSNYVWQNATIEATVNGQHYATLHPERRIYSQSQQPVGAVAIHRRLNEDLYINFAALSNEAQKPIVQVYIFPLVSWIWIGFWVLLMGSFVCLIPSKVKMSYARTEVVGMAGKHEKVAK
jgi:cytochrome c-type biogenesis protein CcmF